MRTLISAALVAGAVSVPAMASTVTLDYLGQDPGATNVFYSIDSVAGAASAGQFKFDVVGTTEELLAWCVEITSGLVTAPTAYTVGPHSLTPEAADNLDKLFTQHYADVTDATSSAAFQTAIWEIVYDSDDLDIFDGSFAVRAKTSDAVEAMATSFLTLGSAMGGYSFTFFNSDVSQNLVSVTPSSVPLPASALLLVAGLGALGVARRRG